MQLIDVTRMLVLLPFVLTSNGIATNFVPVIGGYEFIDKLTNWTDAHVACGLLGGQLALPQSAAEGEALLQLMAEHGATEAHIGFHDLFDESDFLTVLGQSLAQIGFQQGSLESSDDEDCGSFTTSGFKSIPCSTQLPAICQRRPGADFDLVANFGYYKLHKEAVTWTSALRACRQEGAELLIMRSEEEYTALIGRYLNMSTGYWIHYGAHHAFADKQFVTVLGEPLEESGWMRWYSEPVESNLDRPYVGLTIPQQGRDRGLWIFNVEANNSFICKRGLHDV